MRNTGDSFESGARNRIDLQQSNCVQTALDGPGGHQATAEISAVEIALRDLRQAGATFGDVLAQPGGNVPLQAKPDHAVPKLFLFKLRRDRVVAEQETKSLAAEVALQCLGHYCSRSWRPASRSKPAWRHFAIAIIAPIIPRSESPEKGISSDNTSINRVRTW